jgi:hypothetical protein
MSMRIALGLLLMLMTAGSVTAQQAEQRNMRLVASDDLQYTGMER